MAIDKVMYLRNPFVGNGGHKMELKEHCDKILEGREAETKIETTVKDAVLFSGMRVALRGKGRAPQKSALRKCKVTLEVDGQKVTGREDASIAEFIGHDYFPPYFKGPRMPYLFEAHRTLRYRGEPVGIFLTNGSVVKISYFGLPEGCQVQATLRCSLFSAASV